MKITVHFTLFLLLMTLSSCVALHEGTISSSFLTEEYVYEDMAFGVSQTVHVLGVGGQSKDALILEAKRQLYRSRPLKANEAYANFTVDLKCNNYLLYIHTKATVSADVVYKGNELDSIRFSKNYLSKLNTPFMYVSPFEAGDTVVNKRSKESVLVDVIKEKRFRILFKTRRGYYKSGKKSVNNVFCTNKSYNGLTPGDSVEYKSHAVKGIIVGLGINGFLYKERDSTVYYSEYINTATNVK